MLCVAKQASFSSSNKRGNQSHAQGPKARRFSKDGGNTQRSDCVVYEFCLWIGPTRCFPRFCFTYHGFPAMTGFPEETFLGTYSRSRRVEIVTRSAGFYTCRRPLTLLLEALAVDLNVKTCVPLVLQGLCEKREKENPMSWCSQSSLPYLIANYPN